MEIIKDEKDTAVEEAIARLNTALLRGRDDSEPKSRIGLVWHTDNHAMIVDITNVEMIYQDMSSVVIRGKLLKLINQPLHVELHHIIQSFLENKLNLLLDEGVADIQ